jgi:hypothetical protein
VGCTLVPGHTERERNQTQRGIHTHAHIQDTHKHKHTPPTRVYSLHFAVGCIGSKERSDEELGEAIQRTLEMLVLDVKIKVGALC